MDCQIVVRISYLTRYYHTWVILLFSYLKQIFLTGWKLFQNSLEFSFTVSCILHFTCHYITSLPELLCQDSHSMVSKVIPGWAKRNKQSYRIFPVRKCLWGILDKGYVPYKYKTQRDGAVNPYQGRPCIVTFMHMCRFKGRSAKTHRIVHLVVTCCIRSQIGICTHNIQTWWTYKLWVLSWPT